MTADQKMAYADGPLGISEATRRPQYLYVAGPIAGKTAWVIEQNIRAAEAVSLELWIHGIPHTCVHTMARNMVGEFTADHAMQVDLAIIDRCDGIVLVRGWEHSRGTLAEIQHCARTGKLVYTSVRRVLDGAASVADELLLDGQVAPWRAPT